MGAKKKQPTVEPDATAEGLRYFIECDKVTSTWFDHDPEGGPGFVGVANTPWATWLKTTRHPTVAAAVAEMVNLVRQHLDPQ